MDRLSLLRKLSFGSQVAEEEIQDLGNYFVQTDQWDKIIGGHIDIIRGEKGAGKSAIYLLLNQNEDLLEKRKVFICNAENPEGSTVFKDIVSDPPATEAEFIVLWKIYMLALVMDQIAKRGFKSSHFKPALTALQEAGLMTAKLNLSGLLRSAQILSRRLITQARFETGVELNEVTGAPSGIIGRLSLKEPDGELRKWRGARITVASRMACSTLALRPLRSMRQSHGSGRAIGKGLQPLKSRLAIFLRPM